MNPAPTLIWMGQTKTPPRPRTDLGLYLINELHCNPHYEMTAAGFKQKKNRLKKRRDVELVEVNEGESKVIDDGEQKAFVSLNGEFDKDINGLQLEKIFDELIVKGNPKDPRGGRLLVAENNSRGNRGPTVGWSSGDHSTNKNSVDAMPDPNCVQCTEYFAPSFVNVSKLFKKAYRSSKLKGDYLTDENRNRRQEEWAETIDPNNLFELLSMLFILEHGYTGKGGVERLLRHVDALNSRRNGFLLSVWKRFYSPRLGMYVTAVVTACWKHSVWFSYNRRDNIGMAAEYVATQFSKYPDDDIKEVTQDTLTRKGTYAKTTLTHL
jgi:hypothetical protein